MTIVDRAMSNALRVRHLLLDPTSSEALDVVERFRRGAASRAELLRARDAAWSACLRADHNFDDAAGDVAHATSLAGLRAADAAARAVDVAVADGGLDDDNWEVVDTAAWAAFDAAERALAAASAQ